MLTRNGKRKKTIPVLKNNNSSAVLLSLKEGNFHLRIISKVKGAGYVPLTSFS